jgi:glycosyltransferase involved in cell wall biosynthesis
VAERVWTYTGSQKTLPLSKSGAIRRLKPLLAFNASMYVGRLRACLNRLPGRELIVYASHPLHAFALDAFRSRVLSCYDWTDDWTKFELIPLADREAYARLSERMPKSVDAVFAVSRELYERARLVNANTHWMPNATSLHDMLDNPREPDAAIGGIPAPRLGYVGHIGDRIDFDLLRMIAETRPDWSIVMIGPVWSNRVDEAEELGRLPNVHFVGPRPYAALPGVIGQLDACLIPHTLDALTASMDPIKLYDYLATGKPIVTTRVAGVDRFADAVYIAETPAAFVARIEQALAEPDATLSEKRRAYGRDNSWSARAVEMWQHLMSALPAQGQLRRQSAEPKAVRSA